MCEKVEQEQQCAASWGASQSQHICNLFRLALLRRASLANSPLLPCLLSLLFYPAWYLSSSTLSALSPLFFFLSVDLIELRLMLPPSTACRVSHVPVSPSLSLSLPHSLSQLTVSATAQLLSAFRGMPLQLQHTVQACSTRWQLEHFAALFKKFVYKFSCESQMKGSFTPRTLHSLARFPLKCTL